jgi:hypothetical protein
MMSGGSPETLLKREIAGFYFDPLGFVRFAFPWGKPGTRLEKEDGPDAWQSRLLEELGRQCAAQAEGRADAVQMAVASGHGVGKTAMVSWVILWFISTRPHPQIVVTANTAQQLSSKTWRELAKWHALAINQHWYSWSATRFAYLAHAQTWFASALAWSKERPEAFAGTHEENVLVIYDEASLVADSIWEVTEGAMTTPGAVWLAFGNPTRNTGRFSQCFKKLRHRWITYTVDARKAKMANRAKLDKWVADYGEDSDFVRVRVMGKFPRSSSMQLISHDLAASAAGRGLSRNAYQHAPKVLGVDVARFGDDMSVIIRRQGLMASNLQKYRGLDTMALSSRVAVEIEAWRPEAVFVDEVGIGAGVVDRLKQLGFEIIGVNVGRSAAKSSRYHNLRAECWLKLRDWLAAGGCIPDDRELIDDLTGLEYGFDSAERYLLERKSEMKERGLASPDCADALALTFAQPVARPVPGAHQEMAVTEYDPFGRQTA